MVPSAFLFACWHFLKAERQSSIADAERRLDEQQTLQADLRSLQADIQEKRNRVEKIKNDISSSNYDARLHEKTERSRALEDKREQLNSEMRNLTMHADAGIKLDLKRGEVKTRATEIQNMLSVVNKSSLNQLNNMIDLTLQMRNSKSLLENF